MNNKKPTVQVVYTNGLGNNIFQYIYSRLLAEKHDCNLSTDELDIIDVPKMIYPINMDYPTVRIGLDEVDFHQYLNHNNKCNYIVHTYAEDYTLYKPNIERIRTWFKDIPKTNTKDLAFSLRLGDRLLSKRDHEPCMRISIDEYLDVIKKFHFEKLHIITDMKVWKIVTPEEITKMKFHVDVPVSERVDPRIASDYFNSLVEGLSRFELVLYHNQPPKIHFETMRSFDQILLQHNTLAWWAAALSHASKVGVFGSWRPIKKEKNKNLGQVNFQGWFQWGKIDARDKRSFI